MTSQACQIYAFLIARLERGGFDPVSYSDVAAELGTSPQSVGRWLREVSPAAREERGCTFLLSALVARKNRDRPVVDGRGPGDGFYEQADREFEYAVTKLRPSERRRFWHGQLDEIRRAFS